MIIHKGKPHITLLTLPTEYQRYHTTDNGCHYGTDDRIRQRAGKGHNVGGAIVDHVRGEKEQKPNDGSGLGTRWESADIGPAAVDNSNKKAEGQVPHNHGDPVEIGFSLHDPSSGASLLLKEATQGQSVDQEPQ